MLLKISFPIPRLYQIGSRINVLAKRYLTDKRQPSYLHNIGKAPLVYRTIGQQIEVAAKKYGNQDAIVSCSENKKLSFIEALTEADKLAVGLLNLGLKPGEKVGIWSPNSIQWYVMMLAIARAGLVLVPINPAYQISEIAYCIKKVEIKAIFAPPAFKTQNYYKMLCELIPELSKSKPGQLDSIDYGSLKTVIIDSETPFSGTFNIKDILTLASDNKNRSSIGSINVSPDDPCNIQFTSGTTGHPKGTVMSHFSYVNNGKLIGKQLESLNDLPYRRICVQNPLFHAFGTVISVMVGLNGFTLVFPSSSFNPTESLKAIVKEKCDVVYGTPTMFVDLIEEQTKHNFPIDSLQYAVIGGSPLTPQLTKNIQETLRLKLVKNVFGMTECTAVSFMSLDNETLQQVTETIGCLTDHLEAKVINRKGEIVPMGTPGELCIRGYSTMLEYYNDDENTRSTISHDKWLKTGDQFILTEDGYGRVIGRYKDMIIRGGENIFPKEIEDFLNNHPNILEAHVIGVPDKRMGEEICAFIRIKGSDKESMNHKTIVDFCAGKIAHFKIPKHIRVVDSFPKTLSGKIQKFKLKEIFVPENK